VGVTGPPLFASPADAAQADAAQALRARACAAGGGRTDGTKLMGGPPPRAAGDAGGGDGGGGTRAEGGPGGTGRALSCVLARTLVLFAGIWPMRTRTTTAETAALANGRARKMTCTNQITFGTSPVPVRVG